MREIKFRAWHKHEKRMYPVAGMLQDLIMLKVAGDSLQGAGIDDIELMQYIGLRDKNGKEIYEGDIVKTDGDLRPLPIVFDDGAFQVGDLGYYLNKPLISQWMIEIIGNMYENPELVK